MKPEILLAFFFILIASLLNAQDNQKGWVVVNGQPLHFNSLVHDFGTINQNEKTEFKFEFTNDSTDVLVIKHVTASCGCTTPVYSKKPVKPNRKGSITVKYDSSRLGQFSKTILIYTNFALKPIELRITGKVIPEIKAKNGTTDELSKEPANLNTTLPK